MHSGINGTIFYRWAVMLLLTLLLAFSGYSISVASRISVIETKVGNVERRVNEVDRKIDRIGEKLWDRR